MNQLDVYYRAQLDYKNAIESDNECLKLNSAFLSADAENDSLIITRAFCKVDEEWVAEIEKGLVFIEKAIKEDRQFILSQGEVVPIEKVKTVSKESVQHLARHSDLITEYEEGEDIIPDKLYTVERLNDYTVYENRFLYMLLCYLRDFVSLRYTKIVEATNKYDAKLSINKDFMIGKEKISYTVNMHDVRQDDEYLKEHNTAKDIIDRIMLILKAILAFLATPLMEYQAKVPMIKPPITKTNVLKMNNNFKGAVALYDYIISYDKQGFEIENQITNISPFTTEMGADFALASGLMNFLSYQYGLGLKNELKASYEKEEERRKDALIKRNRELIAALEKRLQRSEISSSEYILKLEEQIKLLEKQCERLEFMRREVERLKISENKLLADTKIAYLEISKLKSDMLSQEHTHAEAIETIQRECSNKMFEMSQAFDREKFEATSALVAEISELQNKISELIESQRLEREEAIKKLNALQAEYDKLMYSFNELQETKRFINARLRSYLFKNGAVSPDEDNTDKESFDELENELEVFIKFYKQEWKKAKKRIRKELLNIKNIRKQNEQE